MAKKKKVGEKANPCINIIVSECWKCKNDMLDTFYSNDLIIPYGPSNFTDKQLKIAMDEGCIIKESFSKTMEVSYLAALCPHCGSMKGDFFYHDYAYVPGDVQYFLDDEDNILSKVINKELILRPFIEVVKEEPVKKSPKNIQMHTGKCIKIKFKDSNRTYKYNCKLIDVKVGDKVSVFGKLENVVGEVVEIIGEWNYGPYMQEVKTVNDVNIEESKIIN